MGIENNKKTDEMIRKGLIAEADESLFLKNEKPAPMC
jgi:hypothetical protein